MLLKGVAYHHSGVIRILKELIEILFKRSLIKVLFATETLGVGVNMPAKTVVFLSLIKPTEKGRRSLLTSEYKQLAGRAGRRGKDDKGNVIILPLYDYPEESEFKKIALGKILNIVSKFKWTYQFYLKIIQSTNITISEFFNNSLMNINNNEAIQRLTNEKTILENNLVTTEESIKQYPSDISDKVKSYLTLEDTQNNGHIGSFKISLSKKQIKEFKSLTSWLKQSPQATTLLDFVKQQNIYKISIDKINNEIVHYTSYGKISFDIISKIMIDLGYVVDNGNNDILTAKGIIASQINNCNPLILTEIITEGYLTDLTPQEVFSVLSIFSNNSRSHDIEYTGTNTFEGTDDIHSKLSKLDKFIFKCRTIEDTILPNVNLQTDWDITYKYVDISYKWANGEDVSTIIQLVNEMQEHEGNFAKNMLKIYNICKDITSICELIGKIELLPVLEQIDELVLRDIVNINSIYLGI